MEERKKVKLYQKWWFLGIIICIFIILIIYFVLFSNGKGTQGVGTAGISKEEFDEIQIGKTTNFELDKIIDKNDEWDDDTVYCKCVEKIEELNEDKKYTLVSKYYGEKGGYAIITLQSDCSNGNFYNPWVVIKKEKFDLR